ncbi:MAG: metal-dependent transcriptional regulator [Clostridia bacterium]|nr:metal-dependent transcriptional regulator [Clostridia bacterium]
MNIQKSAEDYLEQILMIREQKGVVRSIDIAAGLGVTKPSVSIAMKRLRENGYIVMGRDNLITLTEPGYGIASKVYDRHKTLTRFLQMLGVRDETAREDACRLEHDISQESYEALLRYLNGQKKT